MSRTVPHVVCDLDTMRFEFYAWAAARAAQAGSSKTTVAILRDALVEANALHWDKAVVADSAQQYDTWHLAVIDRVHAKLTRSVPTISWGIAAKLGNVFIKGNWLLNAGHAGPMRSFGHPAIDSILLRIIDESYGSSFTKMLRWQRMTREQYEEVIAFVREKHPHAAIWTIEEKWAATR